MSRNNHSEHGDHQLRRAKGSGSAAGIPIPRGRRRDKRNLPAVHETSAGGMIVKVENGEAWVALIARRNRHGNLEWCLPKGHVEAPETQEQAAEREVFEETGIRGDVISPLTSINYSFYGAGRIVYKVVHHYLLEATSGDIGVENDPDHEAERAEWVRFSDLGKRLVYANELKVAAEARRLLGLGDESDETAGEHGDGDG